jgi:hypothetical protein
LNAFGVPMIMRRPRVEASVGRSTLIQVSFLMSWASSMIR